MPSEAPEPVVDLRHYLDVLRARKGTILAITLAVLGFALVFSYRQTPLYTAQARILVEPLPSAPTQDAPLEPVIVTTESQLVGSQQVAKAVRSDLNKAISTSSLLSHLEVAAGASAAVAAVPLGSQVLVVTYTSADPGFARDAANAFAADYIKYRGERALALVAGARAAAQRSIDSASNEIVQLGNQIKEAEGQNDTALASALEAQRNALYSRLGVLQQRLDDIQPSSSARSGGAVLINSAELPSSPSSPHYVLNAVVALLFGLGCGVCLILLRERLDKRFKGRADVERIIRAPVLAMIPVFKQRRKRRRQFHVITLAQPKGAAAEAYRSLRTNIQYMAMQRRSRSVLVTSGAAGEGKTVTTVNLGVALALSGQQVILVSADLRRPTMEKYFALERGEGLSSWLVSGTQEDLWNLIRDPDIPNLRVLTSGPIPTNPAELLTSPKMEHLVSALTANADFVLFDSAPVLGLADAPTLASRLDATLLVIHAGTSHSSASARAKEEIERAGGNISGCLLNAFDASASPYYYYESPYYYGRYGSEGESQGSNGKVRRDERPADQRSRSRFGLRR